MMLLWEKENRVNWVCHGNYRWAVYQIWSLYNSSQERIKLFRKSTLIATALEIGWANANILGRADFEQPIPRKCFETQIFASSDPRSQPFKGHLAGGVRSDFTRTRLPLPLMIQQDFSATKLQRYCFPLTSSTSSSFLSFFFFILLLLLLLQLPEQCVSFSQSRIFPWLHGFIFQKTQIITENVRVTVWTMRSTPTCRHLHDQLHNNFFQIFLDF
jgi:hypothetical protein